MSDAPIDIVRLDNGLDLQIYDESKKLVGDRWTVILVARVEVEVKDTEAAAELGERITYEQKRERVFVDDRNKGEVFGELRASFLSTQQTYLAREDFAEKLVQRRLHVHQSRHGG